LIRNLIPFLVGTFDRDTNSISIAYKGLGLGLTNREKGRGRISRFYEMNLDWIIENRTIPCEVTVSLQEVADKYQYSADMMHRHKLEIVDELYQTRNRLS
jgi:hypothetical protein